MPKHQQDESVTFTDLAILGRSAKAIMVRNPAGRPVWVPRSQIKSISQPPGTTTYTIRMTVWIARQKQFL